MRFCPALAFSIAIAFPLMLNGCATPGGPGITLPTVKSENIRYESSGSCTVVYRMTNNFSFTYQMGGQVFMTDSAGNTLGEGSASFPPTLPGKNSQADVRFYNFNLAGNSCKSAKGLIFKGRFCKSVDSGNYVRDDLCKSIVVTSSIKD